MKVSVVIPCHNVERYVRRTLESALAQTHPYLEIICVDDGSTDGTPEILRAVDGSVPGRIRIFSQPNRGACAARNRGMMEASGAYIQFLDADDELMPGKIAHQIALARSKAWPDLIIGSSRTLAPDGRVVKVVDQRIDGNDDWLDLMRHALNITSANLWKAGAVAAVGGWTEGLGSSQEYDLMFRMMRHGARVVRDPGNHTVIHRRAGGSISQTNLSRNWTRFAELRAGILEHVRRNGLAGDLQPYHQVLFDALRILYSHDRGAALRMYREWLPDDFRPGISTATGRGYLMLHRFLGFDLANRIRNLR